MGQLLEALRRIESSCPSPTQEAAPEVSPLPQGEGTYEVSPLPVGEGPGVRASGSSPSSEDVARSRRPRKGEQRRHIGRGSRDTSRRPRSLRDRRPACSELLSHLLDEFPPGRSAVLLLVSPEPEEVATAAVAELARALAPRVTGHVLAVEGSAGRAALTRHLPTKRRRDGTSDPDLTEVLGGRVPWRREVLRTRMERLDVLPGRAAALGNRNAPTARWLATLRDMRREYQFVLIALSSAEDATIGAIAAWADATYLIVGEGRTSRNASRRAVRVLRQSSARLLGCVVVADPSCGAGR